MTPADRLLAIKTLAAKLIDRYQGDIPDDWQHIRLDLWKRGPSKRGKLAVETDEAEL